MQPRQLETVGRVTRNGALEEAARVADTFAKANLILNGNEQEAMVAAATAKAIAAAIRALKS